MLGPQGRVEVELASFASEVIGSALQAVHYIIGEEDVWPRGDGTGSAVHEVDMGVLLRFTGADLSVTWAVSQDQEGLAVASGRRTPIEYFGIGIKEHDVSDVAPWPAVVGSKAVNISWAWQELGDQATDVLWATRIDFDCRSSIVVALGVVDGAAVRYSPDSLVIMFDERVAKSYSTAISTTAAWGI